MLETFKNSTKKLNDELEKKSSHLEKIVKNKKRIAEEKCKKLYIEIISSQEHIDMLYQNRDILLKFASNKITKEQYEQKMQKHKEHINNQLKILDENNVTCDDLYKLYSHKS